MYQPSERRYEGMEYKRCGRSGLKLPAMSLGLWQNFGTEKTLKEQEEILCHAFDRGITHFDLANNYGHPARGLAEENFGRALKDCLGPYRDELATFTKAGYDMWQGPYGNWGSRKYLMASLDQSLRRMGLDYVDIFYHHRPDPETPLEETMEALSDMVRQGKALYVGISNYNAEQTAAAVKLLRENHTPCLIHQVRYNLLERQAEDGLFPVLSENGVGCICFSPLAQGALTDKYLRGIPAGSRAAREGSTVSGCGDAGKNKEVKRHCQSGRHDPGPDGPGLDLTEAGGDFCSGRGQQYGPAGQQPGSSEAPASGRRCAEGDPCSARAVKDGQET